MPLSGNLKEFDLVSILQTLSGKISTGKLVIQKPFKKGILYLQDGKVINAETGKLSGMLAFLELFTWEDGNFEFIQEDVSSISILISMSSEALILEAARIMDEWQEKQKKIQSLTVVPYFPDSSFEVPSSVQVLLLRKGLENMTLEEKQKFILSNIDGRRDLATIARLSGLGTIFAIDVILENISVGRLTFRNLVNLKTVIPAKVGNVSSNDSAVQKMLKIMDGKIDMEEILLEIEEERGRIIPELVKLVKGGRVKLVKGLEYLPKLSQENLYPS
ncbi:MAG TPA: DUF4388 domain-containing protein [Dictyoglomaceae bacterium]|nr:DUF4388 domain-containing protein [Dictyoglomaceae bacterium]HOL38749.1 DUF4388 domain-containing protein [Dictyoglomaceae bacterium]HOP94547.1 DUF4388 domain-containing protein [Dictyoglomaceae bacterium]HPP15502.1 DUF4388 domain-containing protein [Dictyoglomaceae bacterium]HPU43089.1 DUF4388 domain-containing protein [Dictyoglomaceae bacterium]